MTFTRISFFVVAAFMAVLAVALKPLPPLLPLPSGFSLQDIINSGPVPPPAIQTWLISLPTGPISYRPIRRDPKWSHKSLCGICRHS